MPYATKAPRNLHERRAAASGNAPRYVTIEGWRDLTGMSRSGTYRALAAGHLTAIKCGTRTLIDAEAGLAWLASLPAAEFRAPRAA
jgi:hypothetical protein